MLRRIFVLLWVGLFAQDYQGVFGGETDIPKLLNNNVFDQKTIEWRWRSGSDKSIYPYLSVQAEQLLFLNPAGAMISEVGYLPFSPIEASSDEDYVAFLGRIDQGEMSEGPGTNRQFQYHIMSYLGEEIGTIPLEVAYDDPIPALYLANDGRSVLADGYQGKVKISNSNGSLLQEIDLFGEEDLDYEKPIACAIADDMERFAIMAQRRPMTFDSNLVKFISGEPHLFCYSFDGTKLFDKSLECMTAAEIAISPSGNFIVVSQYTPDQLRKSSIINSAGEIVLEIPVLFRYAQFIGDESRLFLSDRKRLFSIDLERKSYLIQNLIVEQENRMVADLVVKETDQRLLILTAESLFQNGQFEFMNPELIQFNQQGEKLWSIEFKQDKFMAGSVYYKENYLGIGFESNYKIYREQVE